VVWFYLSFGRVRVLSRSFVVQFCACPVGCCLPPAGFWVHWAGSVLQDARLVQFFDSNRDGCIAHVGCVLRFCSDVSAFTCSCSHHSDGYLATALVLWCSYRRPSCGWYSRTFISVVLRTLFSVSDAAAGRMVSLPSLFWFGSRFAVRWLSGVCSLLLRDHRLVPCLTTFLPARHLACPPVAAACVMKNSDTIMHTSNMPSILPSCFCSMCFP